MQDGVHSYKGQYIAIIRHPPLEVHKLLLLVSLCCFSQRRCSFGSGGEDFEVFIDGAVTIDTGFESVKNLVAIDELAEDSLVAVEVLGSAESDSELGTSGVLAVVGDGKLATFIVSHGHILILESDAESTNVLFTDTAG